ncbi:MULTISPECIES: aromatic ring-hydroxylating dioxygenase subunit alpha [unclassified Sphingobium]|uniref:aromatic ring-hydroxylating dioxygenase subunit alpha n=1 Tax=unclassified Sphingobium TaxID=2611147 RepID=UPI002224DBEA|nr:MULTISPECIES: aromatic ring-hydroxylating dioxygenase subunit alpha [unclassified Sphingobium]MCW2394994.1 vanillate O-demethylase monooxygenase subunit [Sphingobium sp. B8D3B]MCW2418508.1 vanillate O-demethylase monooxygenase subunit [Sphingobium sp. B8D3C]
MAYVRNAWYVAGWSHELEAEKPFASSILGERIVLWRTASGALHALEDRCVHRLAPLSLGRCEGERLRCMYHGLLFDADGQVVEIPGQAQIPPQARVRRYAVVDRHSWLWVWMGDVDAADERLIPPAVGLDHPDYILGQGHLDYAAEARLINDNLLDFSHLTFVHAESFGSGPQFAATPARITPLERGIRYERWTENAIGSASRRSPEPMDSFMSYDFLIPGVLLMTGGVFPLGTAKGCDYGQPDLSRAVSGVTFTSQAVTPMRDKSARYFFSWGPHRSHGDEALRDVLMRMADQAFAEDKVMIEAQQRVIDDTEEVQVMPTVHDRGVTLFNRLVEKLARQESGSELAAA